MLKGTVGGHFVHGCRSERKAALQYCTVVKSATNFYHMDKATKLINFPLSLTCLSSVDSLEGYLALAVSIYLISVSLTFPSSVNSLEGYLALAFYILSQLHVHAVV